MMPIPAFIPLIVAAKRRREGESEYEYVPTDNSPIKLTLGEKIWVGIGIVVVGGLIIFMIGCFIFIPA